MSQHDGVIDNAAGATVRADLNNLAAALLTNNSGTSAPSTTYANMTWVDTTNHLVKARNEGNTDWVIRGRTDAEGVLAKTSTYTVALRDFGKLIDATSGTWSLNLLAVATAKDGFWFDFRNSGSGTVTLDGDSSEEIDGATTLAFPPGTSARVQCNGSLWRTVGLTKIAGTNIRLGSDAQGDVMYFNGTNWTRLGAGTNGHFLKTQGAAANPVWAAAAGTTLGTAAAATSGTAVAFTGLAAGLKRIVVMFNEVSLSGTDNLLVQLSTGTTFATSGYLSSSSLLAGGVATSSSTAGFIIRVNSASMIFSGHMTLTHVGSNLWIASVVGKADGSNTIVGGGSVTLGGVLDGVRAVPSGANSFDGSGSINIIHE